MSRTTAPLTADEAWLPLPNAAWDADAARHLLRRVGWSAQPDEVEAAVQAGLRPTLRRLLPKKPAPWPASEEIVGMQESVREMAGELRNADPQTQRRRRQQLRRQSREATQSMTLDWLQRARSPEHAAVEKWLVFLGDVYVVAEQKVRQAPLLHGHREILREHAFGHAPTLTKAVSRSPAMIVYLDLQRSRREAPNENFARELFELFVLGEGSYSEADIKEAARAFTGYRQRFGRFAHVRREIDREAKTVFGKLGRWDGDDIIDLAYAEPAAATFLPRELARFYLSEESLPDAWVSALGDWWRTEEFDLHKLALRFFSSRAFFAPEYRGNQIKSPVQFYLGLLQDLDLDVLPSARLTLNALRGMGQEPFNPPNVRGWVGGRQWINSTTLAARRQTARTLVDGIPDRLFNADEVAAMKRARADGFGPFYLEEDPPADQVGELLSRATSRPLPEDALSALRRLARRDPAEALATLLQSPDYQLC